MLGEPLMDQKKEILKKEYDEFFKTVEEILFRHDPIGINFEFNTDEYSPEVGTIIPRLKEAHTESNVLDIVVEEFKKWFDGAEPISKQNPIYHAISKEVWEAWLKFKKLT